MFPLQKDEKVLMYIRRHWIFLFLESFFVFIFFLIPTLLLIYFVSNTSFGNQIIFSMSGFALANILIPLWAIICWVYVAERFTDYALNFWVLTNQRIVECELNGLFNRKTNTMEIEDVEDASVTTPGFIAQFFNFGTLQIQSAGATREFIAEQVKNAEMAKQMVFALKAEIKDEDIVTAKEFEEIFNKNSLNLNKENKPLNLKEDTNKNDSNYDWAKIQEKQDLDIRNITEEIEKTKEEFKKDASDALKF